MKLRFSASFGATFVVVVAFFAVFVAGEEAVETEATTDESVVPLGPITEPPIKLVHVLNPGEREYLSPNLIGVQNIAMTFLPLSMNFLNVIDAFREIVNGVRYEIIVNAMNTKENNTDIICRLVILEQPWIRTEWGDKHRELVNSNCTSNDDNLTDPAGRANALNDKYPRNAVFNGGSRNELSDDEMAKLESQILPFSKGSKHTLTNKNTDTSSTTTTTTTTTTPTPSTTTSTSTSTTTTTTTERIETIKDGSASNAEEESTTLPTELNDTEKKWLDNIFSVGAVNFENSRREHHNDATINEAAAAVVENAAETAAEVKKAVSETISNVGSSASNYAAPPPAAAAAAATQEYDGQQQQLEAQDYVVEDNQQQQQQEEDYYQMEQLDDASHFRAKRSSNGLVGGPSEISTADAEEYLQASLSKVAAGDGPTYKIDKIHSATTQVVAGNMLKIVADLIDGSGEKLRCEIKIWTRLWIKDDGTETTIDCPGKDQVKRRHSRSVEDAEKKTHKKHNHHNLDKVEHLFHKFQTRYNRRYSTNMEHQMRLRIFRQNIKTIEELNRNEQGSAKYGITEFADMTSSEYKERTGLWQREADKPSVHPLAEIPDIELPKEFDWREKGAISKVKNQGSCGSCWAFSVTGNIEGLHAVKTGKLEEYSEQELLDCDTIDSACNGGLPDNAYQAIEKIGGLELESDYPYESRKEHCHFNKTLVHVKIKGAVDLPKNETAMAQWLIANGPISIGINANAMQFYRGGVSHPWHPLCSRNNLDHGVLIVGYGVSDYPMFKKTLPYWIVKNSWGPKWGEQGYYRVYRGDNTCGVSEMATSAVLDI